MLYAAFETKGHQQFAEQARPSLQDGHDAGGAQILKVGPSWLSTDNSAQSLYIRHRG